MICFVISSTTLNLILSRHPCFADTTALKDVAPTIWGFAIVSRLKDVRKLGCLFQEWKACTLFWPKKNTKPNRNDWVSPVKECTQYAGEIFCRNQRHCLGVTFATFVPMQDGEVGVVWTTKRKAYLFVKFNQGWVHWKTLNRQDDPFKTWMKHLRGDVQAFENEISAQRHFHNFVLPYFGTHRFAQIMWRVHDCDPVWELVRRVSYMEESAENDKRFVWSRVV